MNTSTLISIIVPIYNVAPYLIRSLNSIRQACCATNENCEVLLVNDGSTDESPKLIADFLRTNVSDDKIQWIVLNRKNGGLSAARNTGLDHATGEWISFVDSDDFIPADAYVGFLQVARTSGASVVCSLRFGSENLVAPAPNRTFAYRLMSPALSHIIAARQMRSSVCNKFFRAKLFKNFRFIENIYFEDWPLLTCLMSEIPFFACVEEPLYVYCKNATNASIVRSPFNLKKADSYLTGIRTVLTYFHDREDWPLAHRRCAYALHMLVGKTAKSPDPTLKLHVVEKLDELFREEPRLRRPLDFKTRCRLWWMAFQTKNRRAASAPEPR